MERIGLALTGLMQLCLPKAKSQISQGFEALNVGPRKRGKRKQSKECWQNLPSMQQGRPVSRSIHLPSQRLGLAAPRGLSSHPL